MNTITITDTDGTVLPLDDAALTRFRERHDMKPWGCQWQMGGSEAHYPHIATEETAVAAWAKPLAL